MSLNGSIRLLVQYLAGPSVEPLSRLDCTNLYEKKYSKNLIPDSFVSSDCTHMIFSRKFGLAPDLDLHHDPDRELIEVQSVPLSLIATRNFVTSLTLSLRRSLRDGMRSLEEEP